MKVNTSIELFGINFQCIAGLAQDTDRNATKFLRPSRRRYGFVEVGPVSLGRQPEKYSSIRARRRTKHPNKGMHDVILNLQERFRKRPRYSPVVGASLVFSNSSKDMETVVEDYQRLFSMMYDFADMLMIDTSVSNSDGVRPLLDSDLFAEIMNGLLDIRSTYGTYKPIIVKVSPDISEDKLHAVISYCRLNGVDAILVKYSHKTGVSGVCSLVKHISAYTDGRFPICADCGHISGGNVAAVRQAGAILVEGRNMPGRHSMHAMKICRNLWNQEKR